MNQTMEERRPVPGFANYLITRNGTIYSPQGRRLGDLFLPGTLCQPIF